MAEITIIGAGIGGLTTALALRQGGHQVKVHESAASIKAVGAGIVMANNAMQIFDQLGIRQKIENAGSKISNIHITNAQLQPINITDLTSFEEKYKVHNVAIHRADLQNILAEAVGFENIILGKRLVAIVPGKPSRLHFDDGTSEYAEILIGADGIHSKIRNHIFPNESLRDSQQRCWRGICELPPNFNYDQTAYEAWGKGRRFGFVRINKDKIYWFAVINDSLLKEEHLTLTFKSFHPDILNMIRLTPKESINFNEIFDLKPIPQWHLGNICLLGDAAHATTPNMGQGACQAVEDAFIIGKLFQSNKNPAEVFKIYESLRKKKAHFIVNNSWTLGKIAQLEYPWAMWLRNKMFGTIPSSISKKQMDKVFDIEYLKKI